MTTPALRPDHAVDILLIGHVTRDLIEEEQDSAYLQGGTVTFAAVTASRLGRRPTVITRAAGPADLAAFPPQTAVHLLPSPVTTTFANVYTPHGRVQHVYTPAPAITADDIPAACRRPSAVLLGPLVDEIEPAVAALFDPDSLVVAVPQGWMRSWDASGRIHSKPWESARQIVPHLNVLVLSLEDIDYDTGRLEPLFDDLSLVILTEYRDGSTIYQRQSDGSVRTTKVPPRPAHEVDPTGAGDIFATAFTISLQETGDPVQAARFANITASYGVEGYGVSAIPDRYQVMDYMAQYPLEAESLA